MGNPHRYPSKIQIPTAAERRLRRHLLMHNHTVHVDMLVVRWRAKCMHGLPPVLISHIAAEIMHRLRFPSDMTGQAESTATREGSVVVVPRKDAKLARLRRLQIIRASAEAAAAANDERLLHNRSRRRSASDEDDAATETAASPSSSHGAVSMIGRRREMEDAVTTAPGFASSVAHGCIPAPESYDLFGVYDGHCGASVAFACRDRLHVVLAEEVAALGGWRKAEDQWRAVMEASFSRMDRELAAAPGETEVGSTAVVGADCIVVANCSDSRALLCRGGIAVPLPSDHKPDGPDEMKRVEAAGGRIVNWDVHRVSGVLAVSRSLGTWDHYLKQYVISVTEVTVTERSTVDELLIVASDGLWDLVSNETSCRIASRCLNRQPATKASEKKGRKPRAAQAAALLAYSRGSRDNQRGGGSAVKYSVAI